MGSSSPSIGALQYVCMCDASQRQFLFKYKTSVRKPQNRSTRFKLAYVQNASNKDKVGFGIKSCKKRQNLS